MQSNLEIGGNCTNELCDSVRFDEAVFEVFIFFYFILDKKILLKYDKENERIVSYTVGRST